MKKALIIAALLATAYVADAANVASSSYIDLDVRTQGVGALVNETQVDPRGLTRAVSLDLTLDTRIPLGTVILIR